METNNVAIAEAYYTAMAEKNAAGMAKYLHPNVKFVSPLAQLTGKEAVLEAAVKLTTLFTKLTIRAKFGSADQAMLALDVLFPAPVGNFPTAALLTFKDGLIITSELYYDSRPLIQKREEIF